MKSKSVILFIFSLIFLFSCTKYGNIIFETEYDGLLHVDKLWLYDDGVFKIDMGMWLFIKKGTFRTKGDTIFLDYYKYKGDSYRAFIIEDDHIYQLKKNETGWIKTSEGYMGIIKNDMVNY